LKEKRSKRKQANEGLPDGEKDGREPINVREQLSNSAVEPGNSSEPLVGEIIPASEEVHAGANGHPLPDGLTVPGPGVSSPPGNGEPMNVGDPRGTLTVWMCGYDEGPVSRRTGFPCRGKAMTNGRCRFCGGKARRGVAHPKWKGGAYSKYMPKGVATRFKDAMTDPDLLSARDEIALVQLRIQDLMGKLKDGGTADLWESLREEFVSVEAAIRTGDASALDKGLRALGEIIEEGSAAEEVWGEMYEAIEAKTKVSEREWRRLRDLRQFMTVQQSMDLVSYLVECVTTHVTDRDVLGLITRDMDKVLTAPKGRIPEA
jgi:hypothetical protein|tara:strand:- start:282 stop:1232 length:951 start_codon:yes stop_codon:yes gene_type:complete